MNEENSKQTRRRFIVGPAVLVTAAFIGPGTVITASSAGARFGNTLLWAVVFTCLTTIVLQEMAARLGIVSQSGLGQAISKLLKNSILRIFLSVLVVVAILFGNAAYQTGNIVGAATGADIFQTSLGDWDLGTLPPSFFIVLIGILATIVVLIGRYVLLQRVLTGLVIGMSLLFIASALLSQPSIAEIGKGLIPSLPTGGEWVVIGLIGTTVVPYNLFLHASLAANEWTVDSDDEVGRAAAIRQSRTDTILSVLLGGLVTAAILVSASVAFAEVRESGTDMNAGNVKQIARQLEPALGTAAVWLFAIGLFAAGLTSAITAPIAAGYAAAGCFGWPNELSDFRVKATALLVIVIGVFCGIYFKGYSPYQTIVVAQVANGILLPVLAILLLVAANQKSIMGSLTNGWLQNLMAVVVIGIVLLIATRNLKGVYNKLFPVKEAAILRQIGPECRYLSAIEESPPVLPVSSQSLV